MEFIFVSIDDIRLDDMMEVNNYFEQEYELIEYDLKEKTRIEHYNYNQRPGYIENLKGEIYYYEEDYDKAFVLYSISSELGNLNAKNSLGIMYENGYGVEPDIEMAITLYTEVGELGNSNGYLNLGLLYYINEEKGYDIEELNIALEYFKRASDMGNIEALFKIGQIYYFHALMIKQQIKINIYKPCIKQLEIEEINDIELILLDYKLNKKSLYYYLSKKYYRQASELGHLYATFELGKITNNE